MTKEAGPWVAILMGSGSDAPYIAPCEEVLQSYGIPYEARVLSAHRAPDETAGYLKEAESRGIEVIIAAAGMAAHLAGAAAAYTILPVIGIPVASGPLNGVDALYSTVMMPPGLPVATVAINGAANAGHLAAETLRGAHPELGDRIRRQRQAQRQKVLEADASIKRHY